MNQTDKNPWNSIGSVSVNDAPSPAASSEPVPAAPASPAPVPAAPAPASPVDLPPLPVDGSEPPRPDLMVEPSFDRPPVAPAGSTAAKPQQTADPNMPPCPVAAPQAQSTPQQPSPIPQSTQSAARHAGVAPLILGIASILLCFVPVASTIMGVAAIVLTVRAARRGEYSGMLTAGKVTGIIGTVLSVLALILTILSLSLAARMYSVLGTRDHSVDITHGYSQGYTQDQIDAWEAVEERMDALVDQNAQDAAAIADAFSQYLADDAELAPYMQGCDPALYATWAVLGLEYEDDGVFVSDEDGYAYITVTLRDGYEFVDRWADLLDQAASDPGLANTTDEEFAQIFQDTYLKALSTSDEMYETSLSLDLQKSADGTWMITDESWDEALWYLFGI